MLGYVWLGNQNDISTDSVKSIMKENFLTIMPVMALPATWPTALPIATPPAVAAICFIKLGCWGWPMADGGAAMGAEVVEEEEPLERGRGELERQELGGEERRLGHGGAFSLLSVHSL